MASADGNNGGKWDKNFVVALLGLLISFILGALALLFTVATPELRKCFRLEDSSPAPQTPKVPPSPLPQPAPEPVALPVEKKKTVQSPAPEKPKIKPVIPIQRPAESPKQPSLYTLHEDEPQDVAIANTMLSFSFPSFKKESIVSLHISPDGGKQSNHLVWTGDSVEFSSSAGNFLVNILSVNVNEKKISVQVSKTGGKKSTL